MASSSNSRGPFAILGTRHPLNITHVKEKAHYQWLGDFFPMTILEEACTWICTYTDLSKKEARRALALFLVVALNDYKMERKQARGKGLDLYDLGIMLDVNMTEPNLLYTNAPRWTREPKLYKADVEGDVNAKYALALLGNASLFIKTTEEASRIYDTQMQRDEIFQEDLMWRLQDIARFEAKENAMVKHTWGQPDSPFVSVPCMKGTGRVYVTIAFGSEGEIRDLCRRRTDEYIEARPEGSTAPRRYTTEYTGFISSAYAGRG